MRRPYQSRDGAGTRTETIPSEPISAKPPTSTEAVSQPVAQHCGQDDHSDGDPL